MKKFSEKLSDIINKQETKKLDKSDSEKINPESKEELMAEREAVMAEFKQAEQTANDAREAIEQADDFVSKQAENLDPEVKAEIDALKNEANEAQLYLETLRAKLETLNAEITNLEANQELQPSENEPTEEPTAEKSEQKDEEPKTEADLIVEESKNFLDNAKKYGETPKEAIINYLEEQYPDIKQGTEQYSEKWSTLVHGINYINFKEKPYFQKHPEVTFDEFIGDKNHFNGLTKLAEQIEYRKNEEFDSSNYTVQIKGEKGWETLTVDMNNLDTLDDATKEKFLTGIKNDKEIGISSSRLSILIEKEFLKPEEVNDYIKGKRDVLDSFSLEAIKKLQQDPSWAKRIQKEIEATANRIKPEGNENACYFAKILRAGIDSPDVRKTISQIKSDKKIDPRGELNKLIDYSSKYNSPVSTNIFTAKDLGSFVKAGAISHDKLMEIIKKDVDWSKNKGLEAEGKYPDEYQNSERLFANAVDNVYTYKKMGLVSQEELDQLLDY